MGRAHDTSLKKIGAIIRDRRERLDLDQAVVAERADLSTRHYRDIERGNLRGSRRAYLRIATALGIDHDDMDRITGQGANVA